MYARLEIEIEIDEQTAEECVEALVGIKHELREIFDNSYHQYRLNEIERAFSDAELEDN